MLKRVKKNEESTKCSWNQVFSVCVQGSLMNGTILKLLQKESNKGSFCFASLKQFVKPKELCSINSSMKEIGKLHEFQNINENEILLTKNKDRNTKLKFKEKYGPKSVEIS